MSSSCTCTRAGPNSESDVCRLAASWAPTLTFPYSTVPARSNAHRPNKPSHCPLPHSPLFTAPHSRVPTGANGGDRNTSRRRRSRWRFCAPTPTPRRCPFFRSRLRPRGQPPRLREAAPSGSGPRLFLHLPVSSSEAAVPLRCCGRSLLGFRWVSASLSSQPSQRAAPCICPSNNSLGLWGVCYSVFVEASRSRGLDLDHLELNGVVISG